MLDLISTILATIQDAVALADARIFSIVNGACACEALDPIMALATMLGVGVVQTGISLLFVLCGLLADRENWRRAGCAGLVAFAFSGAAVQTAKLIWSRPRPLLQFFEVRIVNGPLFVNSFPSGHSATAFAVMVACSAFVPRLRWALIGAAAVCAVSRVYLGVHFPVDVIYGSLVGVLIGVWSAGLVRRRSAGHSVIPEDCRSMP